MTQLSKLFTDNTRDPRTFCRRCTQQRSLTGHAVTCTPSWYRACDNDLTYFDANTRDPRKDMVFGVTQSQCKFWIPSIHSRVRENK